MPMKRLCILLLTLIISYSVGAQTVTIDEINPPDFLYSSFRMVENNASSSSTRSTAKEMVWFYAFGHVYGASADNLDPLWLIPDRYTEPYSQMTDWVLQTQNREGLPLLAAVQPGGRGISVYNGLYGYELFAQSLKDDRVVSNLASFFEGEPTFYSATEKGSLFVVNPQQNRFILEEDKIEGKEPVRIRVSGSYLAVSTRSGTLEIFNRTNLVHVQTISDFPAVETYELLDRFVIYQKAGRSGDELAVISASEDISDRNITISADSVRLPGAAAYPVIPFGVNKFAVTTVDKDGLLHIYSYQLSLFTSEIQLEKKVIAGRYQSGDPLAVYGKIGRTSRGELVVVQGDRLYQVDLGYSQAQLTLSGITIEELDLRETGSDRVSSRDPEAVIKSSGTAAPQTGTNAFIPHVQLDSRFTRMYVPITHQQEGQELVLLTLQSDRFSRNSSDQSIIFDHGLILRDKPVVASSGGVVSLTFLDSENHIVSVVPDVESLSLIGSEVVFDQFPENTGRVELAEFFAAATVDNGMQIVSNSGGSSLMVPNLLPATVQWHQDIAVSGSIAAAVSTDNRLTVLKVSVQDSGRLELSSRTTQTIPYSILDLRKEDSILSLDVFSRDGDTVIVVTGKTGIVGFRLMESYGVLSLQRIWSLIVDEPMAVKPGVYQGRGKSDSFLLVVSADRASVYSISPFGSARRSAPVSGLSVDGTEILQTLTPRNKITAAPSGNHLFHFLPTESGLDIFWSNDGSAAGTIDVGSATTSVPTYLDDFDLVIFSDDAGRLSFVRTTAGTRRLLARYSFGQKLGDPWFYPYKSDHVKSGLIGIQSIDGTLLFFNSDTL
jgi:hypothetical protein